MSMTGQLTTVESALEFTTAGNAYLTLRSTRTGTRYTYNVRRTRPHKDPPTFTVSVLSGPDTYRKVGFIDAGGLFRGQGFYAASPPVQAFLWYWDKLHCLQQLPVDLEVWHDGACGVCGRQLTVPESVERGIGPECALKMAMAGELEDW